jgi:acyl-coenzyme A synthetase/AMP-(fatty) acid ligase
MSASKRLRVRSQAVFTRYNRNRSEKTGEYLLPDQVSLNSHGAIQLHGRKARIVKIGSKRLSLAEVERALTELPFVEACYVDTYSGRFNRQKIAAVIVSKTATEEIEAHLKTRLSPWKIPARWRRLERLPRTQRGKLDRELLTQVIREPPKNEDKL